MVYALAKDRKKDIKNDFVVYGGNRGIVLWKEN